MDRWRTKFVVRQLLSNWQNDGRTPLHGTPRVQVASDVDDTITCSGGNNPLGIPVSGGIDQRYTHGVAYPGSYQFGLEVARSGADPGNPLPIAVATARPRELVAVLGLSDKHRVAVGYRQCGEQNGLEDWGLGERLYGKVRDWAYLPWTGDTKLQNMLQLAETMGPSAELVFIGDTGQYDASMSFKLAEKVPDRVRALFLHVVQADGLFPEPMPSLDRPAIFFRTYVGGAREAWQQGLLDRRAMQNVCDAACRQFLAMDLSLLSSQAAELLLDLRKCWHLVYLEKMAFLRSTTSIAKPWSVPKTEGRTT